jgi:hypothetical protein
MKQRERKMWKDKNTKVGEEKNNRRGMVERRKEQQ